MRLMPSIAALILLGGGLSAHSGTVIDTYLSTVNNVAILPDNGCVDDAAAGLGAGGISNQITIPAGDMGTIEDVNVQVAITHTWRSDIQMALTDGTTTVLLANNHDGSGDNYHATFDSQGAALCSAAANCGTAGNCVAPPGPVCQPDATLDAFNGAEAGGRVFTLNICDRAAGDLGTLVNWALEIERTPPGVPVTGTYPSTVNNVPILPDNGCVNDAGAGLGAGGISNVITIPPGDTGPILDVDVQVQINHTWRSDIQMALTDGTNTVLLANNHDGSGDNYFATFDSQGAALCSAAANCGTAGNCVAAPGPICQPDASLDVFNGAEAAGRVFTLNICDRAAGDLGTLLNWTLVVEREGAGVVEADLSVTLADAPDPVNAGENLTYTVTATNNGPSDADNVSIELPLPAGTSFVSVNGGAGATCNAASPVVCTWAGPTANGASRVAAIVAAVAPSATGTLNATATVSSDTTDPNPANDTAAAATGVGVTADLSISKTNGVAASVPGTSTVYTIVASNAGPSDAPGSNVTDSFPAACVGVTWTCTGAGGGTCSANGAGNINDVVNLPAGGSVSYSATCPIDPAALGTLDNTASVTAAGGVTDPNPANNSATDSDSLGASADLSITKVAVGVPTPTLVGSSFSYTLTASNAGPSTATAVVVSDSLPATLSYVSNDCGAGFAAPTLTWNVGTLAPGASVVCNLNVTVAALGQISNTASITSATADPGGANNASTSVLTGAEETDMAITLTSNVMSNLAVGDSFVYTVTGTNNGPGVAFDIDFTLELSGKLSFVSSNCGAVLNGTTLSWTVATLASGASSSCQITVTVVLPGDIQASAEVSSVTFDPDLTNNTADLVVGTGAIPVPTFSTLGLLLLGLLLGGLGVVVIRR